MSTFRADAERIAAGLKMKRLLKILRYLWAEYGSEGGWVLWPLFGVLGYTIWLAYFREF